jgi:hypothetical protein
MFSFKEKDIERIAKVLRVKEYPWEGDHYRLKLVNQEERRSMALEIYPQVKLGDEEGSLIVIYTSTSHLQLHFCSGYVVSEELGEVTFVAESGGKLSGLVVERGAACSLYANVKSDLISGDFTKLGVEVMLSGVALSLTEGILDMKASS